MKRVVFCDFDGTITATETFAGMLKDFAPEVSARVIPEIYGMRLTLREGVRQMLESIPSSCYPEIIAYAQAASIRPGFPELLDFLDELGIPLIVVSGGLRDMVETVLSRGGKSGESLLERVAGIYAVDIDTSGEFLQVFSEFEGDTELVSKVKVMAQYPADEKIGIGDSVTDLNMALSASMIFARDRLSQYLAQRHHPYIPWDDFFDIRQELSRRWMGDGETNNR
ncbi:MAG TPA: 2-hydroxy-3-keto-5-methylthiopentenyl-1-phosphate phosphatase [Cyanobacteria bacterium UBA11149]|nr:2-hydroxy-3-keto-5-methylthiopentenyl-1-phosphate phosphatase [Cyanobacteria bacterium UBA11366]HBS69417.1 2-hydroxy-3-keto-5-methylthiopentenyl-1-phosphate phosphatase [Cyanobacteria bacterium UBA11153]HBW91933.1 2-hydroxy-3-keto-5-methylthiopentenyl-1-phosphate phosphatase [Cyanobacteria bacterium UBA11149]HCA95996.1 2-hydroxy-3-keto-5-methylthiopentenyl-1-phosphate phosphatase [Cyanobacteria bacterium UBA9226]